MVTLRQWVSVGSMCMAVALSMGMLPFFGCFTNPSDDKGGCKGEAPPCVTVTCDEAGNVTSEVPKQNGDSCTFLGNLGTCNGDTCVRTCESGNPAECNCSDTVACPQGDNECMAYECNGSKCVATPVADGTPIAMQTKDDCASVVCDGTGSTKTINDDADKPTPGPSGCPTYVCNSGVLKETLCNGAACTTDAQCATLCVDGVCCESACTGECMSCSTSGDGTCTNLIKYQEDTSYLTSDTQELTNCLIANDFACNGTGTCLKLGGSACGANTECLSSNCVSVGAAGKRCKGSVGEPCDAGTDCATGTCNSGKCT